MLQALRISSFAVIEEAEVAFGEGLTVLTGETGAGKSILVDALGLLLGGRADPEVIRAGCDEAVVEGVFLRSDALAARLAELGLPDLGEEVGIRRVVGRGGRGKAYVNGALVTVGVLSRLMRGLVDIAGQHEHTSLFDPSLHRGLLDRVGQLAEPLEAYRRAYAAVRELDTRIGALGGRGAESDAQVAHRLEFLRYQLEEIDRLAPKEGEDERLDAERRRLAGAERLRVSISTAESLVCSQDGSSLETLDRALGLVGDAGKIDSGLAQVERLLASARAELDEASRVLSRYLGSLESDPRRLAEIEERLDALRRLCRKHAAPLEAVVLKRAELAEEVARLEQRRELLDGLEAERADAVTRAVEAAGALTRARAEVAGRFGASVAQALARLAMGRCDFQVQVVAAERPAEQLGPEGADRVEFLLSANPGEPPRPLARVASGGEASRVLLALRRVLAGLDDCRCYVLDEADAGVGGAVADVVGRMIRQVSAHRQVLCITHLPQVAAHADHHLLITKDQRLGRTLSRVVPLERGGERKRELARMLSGVEVSEEALGAAEALLRAALRPAPRKARKAVAGESRVRQSA